MSWNAKNIGGYSVGTSEWEENIDQIAAYLRPIGWTDEAIAGVIGNMTAESGLNPWRWNSDNWRSTLNYQDPPIAYGLLQYYPSTKYIDDPLSEDYPGYGPNFSDQAGDPADGLAQLHWLTDNPSAWGPASWSPYPDITSLYQYSRMDLETIDTMVHIFLANYERPSYEDAQSSLPVRQSAGRAAYEYLTGHPTPGTGLPLWLLFKMKLFNNFYRRFY